MSADQEYNAQYVAITVEAIAEECNHFSAASTADDAVGEGLIDLINAIPYFKDPDWELKYRSTLMNLMEANLPNEHVAAPDSTSMYCWRDYYSYDGAYSGYRDAFFENGGPSIAAAEVARETKVIVSNLTESWWGNYCVPVLTDAIQSRVSVAISVSLMDQDLDKFHSQLRPGLAGCYLGVFTHGYEPTSEAYLQLSQAGLAMEAAQLLDRALSSNYFTANINTIIGMGGEGTQAGMWFLFNLWICQKALGFSYSEIDTQIQQYMDNGLIVPPEVAPHNWWNGEYNRWHVKFTGKEIKGEHTINLMTQSMPVEETYYPCPSTWDPNPRPIVTHPSIDDGYSVSLCEYGSLSKYE